MLCKDVLENVSKRCYKEVAMTSSISFSRVAVVVLALAAATFLSGCDKPQPPQAPQPPTAAPAAAVVVASVPASAAVSSPASTTAVSQANDAVIAKLQGSTFDGKPYNIDMDRGKVILVILSSSKSAIGRDKQPELRANFQDWRTKGFQLVAISTDESAKDAAEYDKLIQLTVPPTQQFPRLWRGSQSYADNFGVLGDSFNAVLINREGKIFKRYSGRISGDDWDAMAELVL
jgi:glutathione peroxidase-family protein